MKKILVTGGGFIGAEFVKTYKKKYDIVAPASEEIDFSVYEEVSELFAQNKFDAVLHLAAKHKVLCENTDAADDLIAFKNIQHAAARSGVKKLIAVSDCSDAAPRGCAENYREDDFEKCAPVFGNGLGRYLVNSLASKDNMSTVLRLFGAFGAGALRADNAITEILAPAVAGKKKQITLRGDKTVSVIYSEDVCKIIALFINNDYPRGIYNVASPVAARLSDFAKKAKAYAKKNDRDIIVEIGKDEQKELTADVSKLLGEIGQFKFTALSTAINKTLDYYKTHKSELKEEKQHD